MLKRLLVLVGVIAATAVPAAFAASSPVAGTYDTTIVGTPVALLNAKWELRIAGSGKYTLLRGGKVVATGTSHVSKKTITFQDQGGSLACLGKNTVGSYQWGFETRGGSRFLYLGLRDDGCTGRKAVLSSGSLLKK